MPLDPQRIADAAAGDPEAMIEIVLAEGHDLRLFIAAHASDHRLVAVLEQAAWATARRQLSLRDTGVSLAEWLRWVAAERIDRHLQGVDLLGTDEISRLVVQDCLAALTDRRDQLAAEAAKRLQAASNETRDLLRQHYGEGETTDQLATRRATTPDAMATALAAVRSACDWRTGTAVMGDRLLPRLLEDWFADALDPDSRALLMEGVARSPAQAAAVVRQVRLHAVVMALHQPFGLREATALARAASKAAESRDQASSFRGRGVSRTTGSDARRPQRVSSSPRIEPVAAAGQSPWLFIAVGVVVLVGVLVLVVMTRDGGRTPDAAPHPMDPVVVVPPPAVPDRPTSPPAGGGVLRPDFGGGRVSGTTAGSLALTWTGDALRGVAYAGERLRLEVAVVRSEQVAAVEFRLGDRLLATLTKAPYAWDWRDPQSGTGEVVARAVGKDGAILTESTVSLRIIPMQGTGKIMREWWQNSGGRTVADGMKLNAYPDRPYGVAFETVFSARRDWGDNYLQRMRGYVVPPASGAYIFWIAGDDEAELWLSSDEQRRGIKRIARCQATSQAAVSFGKWEDRPGQRSQPVTLEAGRRYYVEALHKEGTGNDHVEVGWQLPDGTQERPIPGKRLMPPQDPTVPFGYGALVLATGFEDVSVDDPSPYFLVNADPKVPAAGATVVDGDAAEGRRYLAMRDAPGQQDGWTPEIYRRTDFSSGTLRIRMALRMHAGGTVVFHVRQFNADKSTSYGPKFTLGGTGTVSAGERDLMRLPLDTWVRFIATVGLGSNANNTWSLTIIPPGGSAQEFPGLPCDKGFSRAHQVSFSNTSKVVSVCDLDAVSMHLE